MAQGACMEMQASMFRPKSRDEKMSTFNYWLVDENKALFVW